MTAEHDEARALLKQALRFVRNREWTEEGALHLRILDFLATPAAPAADVRITDDDALRFACRVLSSDAPDKDRIDARDMLMAIRQRVRETAAPAAPAEPVAQIERAFQMLEAHGVPRERARTVANGIDVLVTRLLRAAPPPSPTEAEDAVTRAQINDWMREAGWQNSALRQADIDKVERVIRMRDAARRAQEAKR